ncbi:glucosamine-6-phosphate deaminase [Thalassotalea sp. SU-HH00458]|uniref:glucosamine-6-phosphate deaminase n=1 Tax=Thalassotalea sp. SU-HH00458 TaxID=3127657 RepID=UPI0031075DB5
MKVIICDCPTEVAKLASEKICNQVINFPESVLGLATGRTPLNTYQEIINTFKCSDISFSKVITFNLDEYIGISHQSEDSYHYYMEDNLFRHIDVNRENTNIPNGESGSLDQVCFDYEQLIINSGGIDLQLLGLGSNGHIGFNEPSSSLSSKTRVVTLANSTINDNASLIKDTEQKCNKAITMGIGTILKAKEIVILATGKEKASAVASSIEGAVSAFCPASSLQMHSKVTWIIDSDAAKKLKNTEYYLAANSAEANC